MRATQVSEFLRAWRDAERRWERALPGDPDYEAARNAVAGPWLAYQEASGSIAPDELVLVADDAMRYVAANETAHRTLGHPAGGLIGRSIAEVTAPGSAEGAADAWSAFLRRGRMDGRYRLLTAAGDVLEVDYFARAHLPVAGLHVSRLRVLAATQAWRAVPGAGQSEPPEEGAPAVRGEGGGDAPSQASPGGDASVGRGRAVSPAAMSRL